MKPGLWLLWLAVAVLPDRMEAAPLKRQPLGLEFTYRGYYDNNLLRYSPRDRGRYFDRAETHASAIRSLDDWRSDFKLTASYADQYLNNRKTSLQGTFNFAQHASNPVKNFGWMSFTARQELSEGIDAAVNYFYEPRYYIRDYNDRQTGEFHKSEFALNQWTGRLYFHPSKAAEFVGHYRRKDYFYSEFFTEYDGGSNEFGLSAVGRIEGWRAELGWDYSVFTNTGFSSLDRRPPQDNLNDDEGGQSDYEEDAFSLSLQRRMKIAGRRARAEIALSFARRYWTTGLTPEEDPAHSGRLDRIRTIEASQSFALDKRNELQVGFDYGARKSSGNDPLPAELKTYYRWGGWVEWACTLR